MIKVIKDGDKKFLIRVKVNASITEYDINPVGRLRFRHRVWIPVYEPLQTALI
jgi:hypothetical protein